MTDDLVSTLEHVFGEGSVLVIDENTLFEEAGEEDDGGPMILKPRCIGCLEFIDTPSEADMELFRVGFPVHTICRDIYLRLNKLFRGPQVPEGE